MKYAEWVYDFGIVAKASNLSITPGMEAIRRSLDLNPKEAARVWVREAISKEQLEIRANRFKDSFDFECWLDTPDEEKDNFEF